MENLNKKLDSYRKNVNLAGGKENTKKQKAVGKMTARERIKYLFDPDSFQELGAFVRQGQPKIGIKEGEDFTEGVITGYGKVNGHLVFAYAQDFTIMGGALGKIQAEKIVTLQKLALKNEAPIVALNDSVGAKIQEGVDALSGYGKILYQNVLSSGKIPQISAIMGPCAGGAVYGPGIMDFVFMVKGTGKMFLTGPSITKSVISEEVSSEELGGVDLHSSETGVVHFTAKDDRQCLNQIRNLLGFLNKKEIKTTEKSNDFSSECFENLESIFPSKRDKTYDMHKIIEEIVDDNDFFEVSKNYAKNVLVGFCRISGKTIGVVANQPNYKAGVLDVDASVKAARFIRTCNSFGIGILNIVDLPGYLPGLNQEKKGIIRHGAKLLYAICEASVPKITLIIGKSYGGGYIAMGSKETGADLVYAWPSAEISVMGAESASKILGNQNIEGFKENFTSPFLAAEKFYIDEIIKPRETRKKIIQGLSMLSNKKRQAPYLGNIPL